jgi:hypothetical protein
MDEKLRTLVHNDQRLTVRMIPEELNISREPVWLILMENEDEESLGVGGAQEGGKREVYTDCLQWIEENDE